MAICVTSTNQNFDYLFYTPIVSYMWNYFGFKSLVLMMGSSKVGDIALQYTYKYTPSTRVVTLDRIAPYKEETICQFSRLYAACLIEDIDEYLLTSDMDMLPLSNYFYRDFDKMNLYGFDLTCRTTYPICYIGMTVGKWRNFLNLEYGKFQENMLRDLEQLKEKALSEDFYTYWGIDQEFITQKIRSYGLQYFQSIERGQLPNGYARGRVDRGCWKFDPNQTYIDCHAPRNIYLRENFEELYSVISHTVSNDISWLNDYYEKVIKVLNGSI